MKKCITNHATKVYIYTLVAFLYQGESIMNQNEHYKHQAKTLGEFFKHYGVHNVTPVPSKTNYDFVVQILKQQGEHHAKERNK